MDWKDVELRLNGKKMEVTHLEYNGNSFPIPRLLNVDVLQEKVTRAIQEDSELNRLRKSKADLIETLPSKFIFKPETCSYEPIFNNREKEVLNKMDLLINNRVSDIISFYCKKN